MIKLNFPEIAAKVKKEKGNILIFDPIRKKYLKLTPEEWVRQHAVAYLMNQLHYPRGLISLESGLKFNTLSKRSDILVYDRKGLPFMLVECKAPNVKITPKVFEQASVYNQTIQAPFIMVTNGISHYCCQVDHQSRKANLVKQMPAFQEFPENKPK